MTATPVVVFTAQIGDTYAVKPPLVVDRAARYLCFSDQPCTVAPYEWIPVPSTTTPMLASRRIKILADHPLLVAADLTLWHDASYQLRRNLDWVRTALGRGPDLVAFANPKRQRVQAEARRIVRYGYLTKAEALAHLDRYQAEGFGAHVLTCAGLLGRRASVAMSAFNALWWHEAQQWGGRDQGSLNYAAWKTGIVVQHLKGTIKHNTFADWRPEDEAVPGLKVRTPTPQRAYLETTLLPRFAAMFSLDAVVLNIGAGGQDYRAYFDCALHTSDIKPGCDEQFPAEAIPYADASVDGVLCVGVFERLDDPMQALREFARVLKSGGRLLLGVPGLAFDWHSPRDRWRLTPVGLRHVLRGFSILDEQDFGHVFHVAIAEKP